jgi:alpha-1,3-glucosyltransferase
MSLQQENSLKHQQIASSSLSSPLQHVTIIPVILLIVCIGVLLYPSYYSTDFDVHRNWLSITRHLPLTDWYFDNQQGQTVHTLDYPPTFAYFEAFLSNNYISRNLLEAMGLVDGRCFQILPDSNNRVSDSCIAFHRSTVIISYAVYFIAVMSVAKVVSNAAGGERSTSPSEAKAELVNTITMTLLIFNPGLIFLDFVHFQYNGLLLGILILSLSSITHAAINPQRFLHYDIIGAVLFAFLLGMKHLYLSLAPLYFIYLLRHYCFIKKNYYDKDNNRCQMDKRNESEKENNSSSQPSKEQASLCFQFSLLRFLLLSLVTLLILLLPYVPFFIFTSSPIKQMKQIFSRLFPFGRGLVHDYWAGNIWALYLFLSKGFRFLNNRGYFWQPHYLLTSDGELPNITPAFSAILSLLSLLPALYCAYKVATKSLEKPLESPLFFLHATVSFSVQFLFLPLNTNTVA